MSTHAFDFVNPRKTALRPYYVRTCRVDCQSGLRLAAEAFVSDRILVDVNDKKSTPFHVGPKYVARD